MDRPSFPEIARSNNVIPFPFLKGGMIDGSVEDGEKDCVGPIEQEMRAVLAKLKDCKYPDTFDWSIYDRIAEKFDAPPKGGVVFNTTFKLANWHKECSHCFHSFEIDTYGRGCFHDCVYCYAKDQLSTYRYWNNPQPFPVNLSEIRKTFYTVFETDRGNKWRSIMEQRIPLRVGSMSDSFMWLDTKYGVTKELLRIFDFYNYPYIIFTRSDLVAHDDYMNLLRKDLSSIQFSISGNNQTFIRNIEPGAPSYKRRLSALSKLNKAGFWTTVRINPLFPKYPDGYFSDPEYIKNRFGSYDKVPQLPFFDDQFIAELAEAGVPSVLAGFVRLCGNAVASMSRKTGINIKSFFRPELAPLGGNADGHYSDKEIASYYTWLKTLCSKHGLRFSTCYIENGNKDYFKYQSLWSNNSDCCDAVGNVEAFKRTCQSIPWSERIRHAPNKSLALEAKESDAKLEGGENGIDSTNSLQPVSPLTMDYHGRRDTLINLEKQN